MRGPAQDITNKAPAGVARQDITTNNTPAGAAPCDAVRFEHLRLISYSFSLLISVARRAWFEPLNINVHSVTGALVPVENLKSPSPCDGSARHT